LGNKYNITISSNQIRISQKKESGKTGLKILG
jgi:hypothetical protein